MFTPVAKAHVRDGVTLEKLLPETLTVRAGQNMELVYQYDFVETKRKQDLVLEMSARLGDEIFAPIRFHKKDNWAINDDAFGALKCLVALSEGTYTLSVRLRATCTSGDWGQAADTIADLDETITCQVTVEPALEPLSEVQKLENSG